MNWMKKPTAIKAEFLRNKYLVHMGHMKNLKPKPRYVKNDLKLSLLQSSSITVGREAWVGVGVQAKKPFLTLKALKLFW